MSTETKKVKKAQVKAFDKIWENPMKRPFLEKMVLNIGVGAGGEELERAVAILETITGKKPVKTISKKNVKEFNLRKVLQVILNFSIRELIISLNSLLFKMDMGDLIYNIFIYYYYHVSLLKDAVSILK